MCGWCFSAVEEWHRLYKQKSIRHCPVVGSACLESSTYVVLFFTAISFIGLPPIMEGVIIEVITVAITTDSLRSGQFYVRTGTKDPSEGEQHASRVPLASENLNGRLNLYRLTEHILLILMPGSNRGDPSSKPVPCPHSASVLKCLWSVDKHSFERFQPFKMLHILLRKQAYSNECTTSLIP